jgi:hypothetical protein
MRCRSRNGRARTDTPPTLIERLADLLDQAENYQTRKHPEKKPAAMIAREAVQTAEDARLITLKRAEEERLAKERQDAADREAAEAQRRQLAEQAQLQAQQTAAARSGIGLNAEAAKAAAQRTRIEYAAKRRLLELRLRKRQPDFSNRPRSSGRT